MKLPKVEEIIVIDTIIMGLIAVFLILINYFYYKFAIGYTDVFGIRIAHMFVISYYIFTNSILKIILPNSSCKCNKNLIRCFEA